MRRNTIYKKRSPSKPPLMGGLEGLLLLERCLEVKSDAPLAHARIVVGQSAYISYAYEFEDIVDTSFHFPVGLIAHDMRVDRKAVNEIIIRVLRRVVLVSESSPEALDIHKLSPFESSDEWDAV